MRNNQEPLYRSQSPKEKKSRSKSPKSSSKSKSKSKSSRRERDEMLELRNLGSPSSHSNRMPNMNMNSMNSRQMSENLGSPSSHSNRMPDMNSPPNYSPGGISQFSQNSNNFDFVGSPLSQSQLTDNTNYRSSHIKDHSERFKELRLITLFVHILGLAAIFIGFIGVINDYSEGVLKSFNFFFYQVKSLDPAFSTIEAYYGYRALVRKVPKDDSGDTTWVILRFDDVDDVDTCARDEELTVSLYMIGMTLYIITTILAAIRVCGKSYATVSMAMINFCLTLFSTGCVGASFYIFWAGCFKSSSISTELISTNKTLQICGICVIAGVAAALTSTFTVGYEFFYSNKE